MPRLAALLLLAACTGSEKPDDTASPDDTGPVDTDTDVVTCDPVDPVTVTLYNDRLWYVEDATVRWSTSAGESGDCVRQDFDRWECDAAAAGDLTISAERELYVGASTILPATEGCRAGGELVELTLVADGAHFDASRMYYFQKFEDDYECEHSWEIHGVGCYYTAAFCDDGYSVVMVSDIANFGIYDLKEGAIENTVFGVTDIPEEVTFSIISETELSWDGNVWELDTDGKFGLEDCPTE